ncbi:hypothetical protein HB943_02055 [Listeria weihenstephanensis]|uniref:Uncharacterized protein n=1 Tax=Listeria weihenstephanensis TaxID=1006155 RepID=A0A841Z289_9LIST|nr:hypothetical protein [Listeria weihenstephanensis]MBC1499370.1 hypothetical protein [Listeria weihenstephanensis]
METVEFKAILEEMDLAVRESTKGFLITEDESCCDVATVSNRCENVMCIVDDAHVALGRSAVTELFELLTAYASTPLDKCEPERKWYLRDPVKSCKGDNYLNIMFEGGYRIWSNERENSIYQTQFTRAEIEAFTFPTEHLIEDEVKPDGR